MPMHLSSRLIVSLLISVIVLVGSFAMGNFWLPVLLGLLIVAGIVLFQRVRRGLVSSMGSTESRSAIATLSRHQPPRWAATATEAATDDIPHAVMASASKADDDPMREWRERRKAMFPPAATGPTRAGVAATWMPLR